MEINAFTIYLISCLSNISFTIGAAIIFTTLIVIIGVCMYVNTFDNSYEEATTKLGLKLLVRGGITLFILCLAQILIPSSKTVIAMLTIPPIVNNEQVQQLPTHVLEFIDNYLKNAKED